MTRIRIAFLFAAIAAALGLVGCSAPGGDKVTWNAAPAPVQYKEDTSAVVASEYSSTGIPGVLDVTGSSAVALTFDDGPDPTWTPKILAMLKKYDVKATFCLVGSNAKQYPNLVRDIVADGHTLCNHTWNHDFKLGTRSESEIRADLQKTNDAILAAVPGAKIGWFRHPGGMWTPSAVKVAAAMGMKSAGWAVDPEDWNAAKYKNNMKQHILDTLASVKAGAIVLSHDAGGDRSATLAAYDQSLPNLKAKFKLIALPS